jgi:hypothetical protein
MDLREILAASRQDRRAPRSPNCAADLLLTKADIPLSTRGVRIVATDSTHYIQYDQPRAVIDAVTRAVTAIWRGALSKARH